VRGKYEPIPSFYSKDLADIISKCLQRDTRKRLSIHELLELDVIKKKAKTLNIHIPTKEEVMSSIENQKIEMISTFQKKKTDVTPKGKSKELSKFGKDKSSDRKKSNLSNYKHDIPRKGSKSTSAKESKTDHQIKVEELENKVKEKNKKHEEYLKKRGSDKSPNEIVPESYLKDPSLLKGKSEGRNKLHTKEKLEEKYVNRSALALDVPKGTNQKVIKQGVKQSESEIVIPKPKKPPQTSQEIRAKTTVDPSVNLRNRPGGQQTGLSRQAQVAAIKGQDLYKKKQEKGKKEKAVKKDIEDVYNLPDFPKQESSSSDEERMNTMNKPAMQLVAELRAKHDIKVKKHFSAAPAHSENLKEMQNAVIRKDVKGSYNPAKSDISSNPKFFNYRIWASKQELKQPTAKY
jgi:serine/threonine protein kinase